MHPFIPSYSNPGGRKLINTLQQNHIMAILNAKPAISKINPSNFHKKRPNSASAKPFIELQKSQSLKSTNLFHRNEVSALVNNLIEIDRKAFITNNILRKQLKKNEKIKPQTNKNFFVSKYNTLKENALQRVCLDKLLEIKKNPKKKTFKRKKKKSLINEKINNYNNNPLFLKNSKSQRISLNFEINKPVVKKPELDIYSSVRLDNFQRKKTFNEKDLDELKETGFEKKKLIDFIVKYRIIDKEKFEELKKEILKRSELGMSLQIEDLLMSIMNYLIK